MFVHEKLNRLQVKQFRNHSSVPSSPGQFWGPTSLPLKGHQGLLPQGGRKMVWEAGHSLRLKTKGVTSPLKQDFTVVTGTT